MSLTPQDLALLDLARDADDPSPADRERVRGELVKQLGAGAVLTAGALASRAAARAGATAGAAKGGASAGGVIGAMSSLPLASKVGIALIVLAGAVSAPPALRALRGASSAEQGTARLQRPADPLEPTATAAPATEVANAPPASITPLESPPPLPSLPSLVTSPARGAHARPARVPASVPPTPTAAAPSESAATLPPPTPAPAKDRLAAETTLLREATTSLSAGDAARALTLLDRHAQEFPSGTLAEDRGALRVRALCRLGRASEAARAATSFLQDHPFSPLAASVQQPCASSGGAAR